ncbi:MAG: hypothetical protein WA140_11370 [Geobacteraceae bacterium]
MPWRGQHQQKVRDALTWEVIAKDYHENVINKDYRTSNYYCGEPAPTMPQYSTYDRGSPVFLNGQKSHSYADTFGDGNWHTITMYLKMDSSPGAADGESKLWIDGNLSDSRSGIRWRSTDGDANAGWNTVGLGGNAFNNYLKLLNSDPFKLGAEQWYAIDDVIISTTPIPQGYVIGGGPAAPKNVTGTPIKP